MSFDDLKGISAASVLAAALLCCASTPPAPSVWPDQSAPRSWTRVPAGTMRMGSDPDSFGHDRDEEPRIELSIASFEMMTTPVTVGQWQLHAHQVREQDPEARWWQEDETPAHWVGRCNLGSARTSHPANCVSYRAAYAFCRALGSGLPTEAEREYAMRSGSPKVYPWGDTFDASRAVASVTCATRGCEGSTSAVVLQGPRCNAFGLCDMIGNVWEWTATDYQESLGPSVNLPAKAVPARPVHRGGSWLNEKPEVFRVSMRGLNYPTHGLTGVGFRCVRR